MMSERRSALAIIGLLALFPCPPMLVAEPPPLIPREVLFGNPDRTNPQISPDGERLAYVAPHKGVLNVWVRTIGQDDDRPVTHDLRRGVRIYFWAFNNEQLLYLQDKDGDENWHLYAVKLETSEIRDLTPFAGIQARVVAIEPSYPDEILVAINDREPRFHDAYRINIRTGRRTKVVKNKKGFVGYVADGNLDIRGAVTVKRNGGVVLFVRDRARSLWRRLTEWAAEDSLSSGPVGFSADGQSMYIISSTGANTGELRRMSLADGTETLLASDETADVADLIIHPVTREMQAVSFSRDRIQWRTLEPSIQASLDAISQIRRGDFALINRDLADKTWLVYFTTDDGPIYYYRFDRTTQKADLLFANRSDLEYQRLAQMEPFAMKARDGLTLHGYLTIPPGTTGKRLPTVLLVHPGPWSRDRWGYNGEVQWLANRGYAVVQINYRGSRGYGKAFLNAGNREWGGKMQDDLVDAVNWSIERGVTDPDRIAIYGGDYGGYAALTALTDTPDLFCCAVDVVGPSNLITFMENLPPYWKPIAPILWDRVGHPDKDAEFLRSRSPLFKIDRITKPLLIAQGANDPRVKRSETRQIVAILEKAGKEVEFVEYPDEGHGFRRPKNRLDFYARAEKFLAKHLGGRFEPPTTEPNSAECGSSE